jgi:hypothetical protein
VLFWSSSQGYALLIFKTGEVIKLRNKAVDILQHYFAVAMGKRSAAELSADSRSEIEDAVDCIIDATREPAPVGPDYSRAANPTARAPLPCCVFF